MLVLKVCINYEQIDEIHIQNVGKVDGSTKSDMYVYKIRSPEGYENVEFYHSRQDGAIELISQVISYLANADYRTEF